eukprot:7808061-Pyramimonas_sp.AAC.1
MQSALGDWLRDCNIASSEYTFDEQEPSSTKSKTQSGFGRSQDTFARQCPTGVEIVPCRVDR